jgi:hypothetical protein
MRRSPFPVPKLTRDYGPRKDTDDPIGDNKQAIAAELLMIGSARITDLITWDAEGIPTIKASEDVSPATLAAIRRVTYTKRVMGDPDNEVVEHKLEFEMHDKAGALKALAKAAGLMDRPKGKGGAGFKGITVTPPPEPEAVPSTEKEKVG